MLCREIITVYSETHTKHKYALRELTEELPIIKPCGKYSDSWALEVENECQRNWMRGCELNSFDTGLRHVSHYPCRNNRHVGSVKLREFIDREKISL